MESKYKYESVTETIEIEIEDSWVMVLAELDRLDHNSNQTETRRHCSLNALNLDDTYLPSDVNVEEDAINSLEREMIREAIQKLSPRQQRLVFQVYFGGLSYAEIARREGLEQSTIRKATDAAVKKLKKVLKKLPYFASPVSYL